METVHGIIRYHPPIRSAEYYASRALAILTDLEEKAFVALPTFLSANSILTLSGVRAFDAYHEFYDYVDEHQAALARASPTGARYTPGVWYSTLQYA